MISEVIDTLAWASVNGDCYSISVIVTELSLASVPEVMIAVLILSATTLTCLVSREGIWQVLAGSDTALADASHRVAADLPLHPGALPSTAQSHALPILSH